MISITVTSTVFRVHGYCTDDSANKFTPGCLSLVANVTGHYDELAHAALACIT